MSQKNISEMQQAWRKTLVNGIVFFFFLRNQTKQKKKVYIFYAGISRVFEKSAIYNHKLFNWLIVFILMA